jgi:primary-amine oxidase
VVSLVTYDGRSVLYQGSLAEVFVPYQDPDANWFYRTYMDEGEFGFGTLSSPLALGLDVPENAVLLDGLISAALPDPTLPVVPLPLPKVVGVFERLTGSPVWRHFEQFSGGVYEGRAEVELVVRSIAQVGNYDYMIDWIFTQKDAYRDPNMLPDLAALQRNVDMTRDLGFVRGTIDIKKHADLSIVEEAAKRLQ